MGIYTHTMTASEFSLKYRSSSKWTNYSKLYDGDAGTYPTSQSGGIGLLIDMSWLPAGMRLCGVQARAGAKRTGNSNFTMRLRSTNATGEPLPSSYYTLAELSFDTGEYNTWSWHSLIGDDNVIGGTLSITAEQSADFLSKTYQYITMNESPQKSEIELTFLYTESNVNKIYVGENKISAVYVGNKKASAVYIGTTQVL